MRNNYTGLDNPDEPVGDCDYGEKRLWRVSHSNGYYVSLMIELILGLQQYGSQN